MKKLLETLFIAMLSIIVGLLAVVVLAGLEKLVWYLEHSEYAALLISGVVAAVTFFIHFRRSWRAHCDLEDLLNRPRPE